MNRLTSPTKVYGQDYHSIEEATAAISNLAREKAEKDYVFLSATIYENAWGLYTVTVVFDKVL